MTGPSVNGLVSVVIPTFNREDMVCGAIDSALAQTYQHLEVVVVDDGSTDRTGDKVRARYGSDPRVRYLWQENGERARARNAGIHAARGEFVAFLDSDDRWRPAKLQRQVALFLADPGLGLVHCGFDVMDSEGRVKREVVRNNVQEQTLSDAFDAMLAWNPIGCLTVVVPRRCFDCVGLFEEDPRLYTGGEDWNLWLKLAYRFRVGYVPEVLADHVDHDGATEVPLCDQAYAVVARNVLAWVRAADRFRVRNAVFVRESELIAETRVARGRVAAARRWTADVAMFGPRFFVHTLKSWRWRRVGRGCQVVRRNDGGE